MPAPPGAIIRLCRGVSIWGSNNNILPLVYHCTCGMHNRGRCLADRKQKVRLGREIIWVMVYPRRHLLLFDWQRLLVIHYITEGRAEQMAVYIETCPKCGKDLTTWTVYGPSWSDPFSEQKVCVCGWHWEGNSFVKRIPFEPPEVVLT